MEPLSIGVEYLGKSSLAQQPVYRKINCWTCVGQKNTVSARALRLENLLRLLRFQLTRYGNCHPWSVITVVSPRRPNATSLIYALQCIFQLLYRQLLTTPG